MYAKIYAKICKNKCKNMQKYIHIFIQKNNAKKGTCGFTLNKFEVGLILCLELVSYDLETLKKYACWKIEEHASLDKFLEHFKYFAPVFVGSRNAIRRLTLEAIEDCSNHGYVYVEYRFCPHLLANVFDGDSQSSKEL